MLTAKLKQPVIDFYHYPLIGDDDWRYVFATARVRALQTQMLTKATFSDMAGAAGFEQVVEILGATEYAAIQTAASFLEVEECLHFHRAVVRNLFAELMLDEPLVRLLQSRDDFANMRLAVRRIVTERPLGQGYSYQGNVSPDLFEEIFEHENYELFPDYLQEAVERAILGYYEGKDIRRIDYAIDAVQSAYELKTAGEFNSIFLLGLYRIQIDLTNIRTILRLKWSQSEQRNVLIEGGFLNTAELLRALESGYEGLPGLFFATPYYEIVSSGVNYLTTRNSFLRLEQLCEDHVIGFLKLTNTITPGPQPVIAYLLMKENDIRKIRLILTAKKHSLEPGLLVDRLGE